jgi:hypothetical protein
MKLKDAHVTGYGTNPLGHSTCYHCGMGLKHVVFVRDPDTGKEVTIGSNCAERVGVDPAALRSRTTTEQAKARREREAEREAKREEKWKKAREARAKRVKPVLPVVKKLREYANLTESTFYGSIADQLESNGNLSWRQAEFVCKALVGTTGRRNKKNAAEWDSLFELICR